LSGSQPKAPGFAGGYLLEQSEVKRAENRKRMHLMQSAMTALFKRLEAFIRGLERHDGHQSPGTE